MASMPAVSGMFETPADHVLDRTVEPTGQKPQEPPPQAAPDVEALSHDQDHGQDSGEALDKTAAAPRRRGLARLGDALHAALQFFVTQSSSSLTRRIVVLNVTGLFALSIGILFLSQFRAGLIDARNQSLQVQAEIIAGAIASSATVETDSSITLDPDKLLNLHAGESYGPNEEALYGIEFPINPERVAPILRRLVSPTKTRARIYDRDGVLLVDSRNLFGRGDVLRFDLPPPTEEKPGFFRRAFIAVRMWLRRGGLPVYRELGPDDGRGYPEVAQALNGADASMVRVNERGDVIVSVAVPVQRFR